MWCVHAGVAPRASLLHLEGKALNVLSVPSARAEEVLSQAVKLSPGLADAWNQLGECYWKQGRVAEAKDCFLGALQHVCTGLGLGVGGGAVHSCVFTSPWCPEP